MTSTGGVEVVILTALGLEYDAVRAHLADTRQHTDANGTRYEIGTPRSGAGRVALALIGETDLTVPLPVVTSCVGPSSGGACMDIEDGPALYMSGIGQRDVRFTPLQNAMIAATIANGGMRMRPQLTGARPEPMGRAMTESNAGTLRDMMIRAESATGGSGRISDLRIAAKTGTAQSGPDAEDDRSWYVAFAPADEPEIAIAVLLEDKDDAVAASIGRAVINEALAGGS